MFLSFLQCLDRSNLSVDGLARTLIWSFELIPAPAAQYVRPTMIKGSLLDKYFLPVELDKYCCNCSSSKSYCLVSMISETSTDFLSDLSEEDNPVFSKDECSLQADDQDNSDGHHSDSDEVEYFSESFSVKG